MLSSEPFLSFSVRESLLHHFFVPVFNIEKYKYLPTMVSPILKPISSQNKVKRVIGKHLFSDFSSQDHPLLCCIFRTPRHSRILERLLDATHQDITPTSFIHYLHFTIFPNSTWSSNLYKSTKVKKVSIINSWI